MPGNFKPIIFLRKKIQELLAPGWVKPKPVYMACGLLMLAGVLLSAVTVSLQSAVIEQQSPAGVEGQAAEHAAGGSEAQIPAAEAAKQAIQPQQEQPVPAAAHPQKAQWPLKGDISRDFGWQLHPVFNDWRYHPGLDISAADGTFVRAALSGRITDIYTDHKTGLTVVIVTGKYTIGYGSLDTINVSLKKGSYVNQGDQIGTVGACATEPYTHLHLTVKEAENYIDPRKFLK